MRANAVVFPFDDPVGDWTERVRHFLHGPLKGMREIEWIGTSSLLRLVFVRVRGRGQRREIRRSRDAAGLRITHHALRHASGVDAGRLRKRLRDLQSRDADPQFAGNHLEEDEPLRLRELGCPFAQSRIFLFLRRKTERQEAQPHPLIKRQFLGFLARRQKQSERLGKIADGLAALFEKPFRKLRLFEREAAQQFCRRKLARLAAREEIDRPGGACMLQRISHRGAQIVGESLLLALDRGGGVEFAIERGECLHGASSACASLSASSPPYSVCIPRASRPASRR